MRVNYVKLKYSVGEMVKAPIQGIPLVFPTLFMALHGSLEEKLANASM